MLTPVNAYEWIKSMRETPAVQPPIFPVAPSAILGSPNRSPRTAFPALRGRARGGWLIALLSAGVKRVQPRTPLALTGS
jgi:hypothetical protein